MVERKRERYKSFYFSAFEDRRLCWRELFGSQAGELACTEGEGKFFDVRDGEAEKKREIAHAPRLFIFVLFFIRIFSIPWFHPSSPFSLNPESWKEPLGVCVWVIFLPPSSSPLFCQGWARVGSKAPPFFSCRSVGH